MKVTRIMFSTITFKWYLEINKLQEVEIHESVAKDLIKYYNLVEYNLNRWMENK